MEQEKPLVNHLPYKALMCFIAGSILINTIGIGAAGLIGSALDKSKGIFYTQQAAQDYAEMLNSTLNISLE